MGLEVEHAGGPGSPFHQSDEAASRPYPAAAPSLRTSSHQSLPIGPLPMTQGRILSHPPWTGPGPGSTHLLTEGEPWKGIPWARERGDITWAVPKGQEGPRVGA